jgi:preprotein translocase subunit SecB
VKAILSPLRLKAYAVDSVSLRTNPLFDPSPEGATGIRPEVEVAVTPGDEEGEFLAIVGVHIGEGEHVGAAVEAVPYFLDIQVGGLFSVPEDLDDERRGWFQAFNAPAILYGLARAEMAHLTEKGRAGTYILPTVDFIAMGREVLERSAAEEAAGRQKAKRPATRRRAPEGKQGAKEPVARGKVRKRPRKAGKS